MALIFVEDVTTFSVTEHVSTDDGALNYCPLLTTQSHNNEYIDITITREGYNPGISDLDPTIMIIGVVAVVAVILVVVLIKKLKSKRG